MLAEKEFAFTFVKLKSVELVISYYVSYAKLANVHHRFGLQYSRFHTVLQELQGYI